MLKSVALSVVVAGLAIPSMASAAPRQPSTLVYSLTEADLRDLVLAEGHTIDKIHPFDAPSVRGKTKDGLLFVITGTACDKGTVKGCQGAMMQVRYDSDDAVTLQKMGDANMAQAAVSSWWDQNEKTVGFTRYVVLDDGVTWMNLRRNLQVLISIQAQALKKIWPD